MSTIRIEGCTLVGDVVTDFVLEHGRDPAEELEARGFAFTAITHAFARDDAVVLRVGVVPLAGEEAGVGTRIPAAPVSERVPAGATIRAKQRLSAYAVIVEHGSILLTQLSAQVATGEGLWTLPGGGVDEGEDPSVGVRREVWEETGQHLGAIELIDLVATHWVGRAPSGRWEDYQVVRLIYRARVPLREPLVVHDVGGTTADARWIALDELADTPRAALIDQPRFAQWLRLAS